MRLAPAKKEAEHEPPGESALATSAVTFSGGIRSRARSVTVEYLDDYGIGVFTRK